MEPREIVQAAIDAYHAHDLDTCLGFYAPNVVVKDASGKILMNGTSEVRARYAKSMSDHPKLHYDIPNRIAFGNWVVDEERITGMSPPRDAEIARAILVYLLADGVIAEITVFA